MLLPLLTDELVVPGPRLDAAAAGWAERLGVAGRDRPRTVVALTGASSPTWIAAYVGARRAGHVVLPLAAAHAADVAAHVDAGLVVDAGAPGAGHAAVEERHRRTVPLHDDLALLLTTSGSTGSPKLVRLSYANVAANAAAIATYLRLSPTDVGITSLPLHYCYGLSVLESHLHAGAPVVAGTASVVDPCFWAAVRRHGVTNIAGVPHTFELMERSDSADLGAPSLRFLTQAGGRMDPERVRRWARLGAQHGWQLFVMYGQTEATSRIAYLPPELVHEHPGSIGRAVPGGALELRPHPAAPPAADGAAVGELVYRGPNVMMGYAEVPDDLARGPELAELRTGDLARHDPASGLYAIVGRASRFVKPFGVRLDLDHLEWALGATGARVVCTGTDRRVVIAVEEGDPAAIRDLARTTTGLPDAALGVHAVDQVPRLPNGKPDHAAVLAVDAATSALVTQETPGGVAGVLAAVLGVAAVSPDDTFVGLGGDSLSYIEAALRLEEVVGELPEGWHLRTVAELEASRTSGRRAHLRRVDTTVLLRALGICAVVATHMRLVRFPGGAHLLLAVVGYNVTRFLLPVDGGRARLLAALRTAARVGLPASAWIGANMAVAGGYSLGTLLLVNNYTGSSWRRDGRWQYWFFEVFVQLVVVTGVLLAVPAVRRLERRAPWWFAVALLAPLLVLRFGWVQWGDPYNHLFRTHTVAWFFVLGWAIGVAGRRWQRVVLAAVALTVVPGFFDRPQREWFVISGLLVLLWLPRVPLPRAAVPVVTTLAAASMWIFLVHWQVWPPLDRALPRELAYLLTLAVGIAVHAAWVGASRWVRRSAPRVDLHAHARAARSRRRGQVGAQLVPRPGAHQEPVGVVGGR